MVTNPGEEEEERLLNYESVADKAKEILDEETGSCIAVHYKFLVLGTQKGHVHFLSHQGGKTNLLFTDHSFPIIHLSVDTRGETLSSCCENGFVIVQSTTPTQHHSCLQLGRNVNFCVVDPNFERNRRFLVGGDRLLLYQRKLMSIFTDFSATELLKGEGPLRTCSWTHRFPAFSTDSAVFIFDIDSRAIICRFKRELDPDLLAEQYLSRFAWKDDFNLIMGWANKILLCTVKRKDVQMRQTSMSKTDFFLEISKRVEMDDIFICGLAPCDSNIAILGTEKINNADNTTRVLFQLIETEGRHNTQLTSDEIPLNMTSRIRTDLMMSSLDSEQRYFIMSPKRLLLARKTDRDDLIDRLIAEGRYETAMQDMTKYRTEIKRHTLLVVGQYYLKHLIETKDFEKVGPLCKKIFGQNAKLWEEEICVLSGKGLCSLIAKEVPYEPHNKLSPESYEVMLNEFLNHNLNSLPSFLKRWKGLYNPRSIHNAIRQKMKSSMNKVHLESVGILTSYEGRFNEALDIFFSIGATSAIIELLSEHKDELKNEILDRILDFMKLDAVEAAKFFAAGKTYPVKLINQRLANNKEYQMEYLRCAFAGDPENLDENDQSLLVEYYLLNDSKSVLPFLKKSNKIPLEKTLKLCQDHENLEAVAYLYERMGDLWAALRIIVKKIGNVEQAIQFCQNQAFDENLWKYLIDLCVHDQGHLTVLLERIGNFVDPSLLIEAIPLGLEVPHLRDSLVRIIHDYKMLIALRESCRSIVFSNRRSVLERLYQTRKASVKVVRETACDLCGRPILQRDPATSLSCGVFACGHSYHMICLEGSKKCKICTRRNENLFGT